MWKGDLLVEVAGPPVMKEYHRNISTTAVGSSDFCFFASKRNIHKNNGGTVGSGGWR